jgi:hypothetical protein
MRCVWLAFEGQLGHPSWLGGIPSDRSLRTCRDGASDVTIGGRLVAAKRDALWRSWTLCTRHQAIGRRLRT